MFLSPRTVWFGVSDGYLSVFGDCNEQNAAEKPPFFLPSWTGMFLVNLFIVVWVLVVGFGIGGWASMVNFVKQIDTFGLFAKCYQCPKPTVVPDAAAAPLPHH
jgi:auxin influx carrier (AUX1 LAX family)